MPRRLGRTWAANDAGSAKPSNPVSQGQRWTIANEHGDRWCGKIAERCRQEVSYGVPVRLLFGMVLILTLSACVVAPGPCPYGGYPGYGYAPGYYGPAYVAAPPIVIGGGWGWGWHHWR